jgi:hypothetical protein
MKIPALLLFLSMGTLCGNELSRKLQDDEEIANGVVASSWRLTVQPHPGQLVMTRFIVEVGEELEAEFQLTSRKIEMIHYVPKGNFTQDVGYKRHLNLEQKVHDPQFNKKWEIWGLGQNVTLGPLNWAGGGGGTGTSKVFDHPCESANRRFRLTSDLEAALIEGREENPSKQISFNFHVYTQFLDIVAAKAAEAGIDKLPELNGEPWSITLPQMEQPVESGRNGVLTRSPHTTKHTGPY